MPRPKANADLSAILQRPSGASLITGLSVKAIRQGCKDGSIPHIQHGRDYLVNMPLFIEQLNSASLQGEEVCSF